MLNNFKIQTGAANVAYEAALPLATGISSTGKRNDSGEGWAKTFLINAAFITTISHSSAPSINWYANATAPFDPLAYSDILRLSERPRVLTSTEQAIFHRALRRSAKMIHKAKRDIA